MQHVLGVTRCDEHLECVVLGVRTRVMFDQLGQGGEGDLAGDVEAAGIQVTDSVVLDDVALVVIQISQREREASCKATFLSHSTDTALFLIKEIQPCLTGISDESIHIVTHTHPHTLAVQ